MINLLPQDTKTQIRFARWNVTALRYIALTLILLVSIAAVTLFGIFYMQLGNNPLKVDNAQLQTEVTKLSGVQKEAEDLSSKIKLINAVFDKETDYTEVITRIGSALPPGSRISAITLTPKSLDEPISLSVDTPSLDTSASIIANFKDPSIKLFSTADIESTTCSSKAAGAGTLPCSTNIRAIFSKEAFKKAPAVVVPAVTTEVKK
jgi:hypothetical protein